MLTKRLSVTVMSCSAMAASMPLAAADDTAHIPSQRILMTYWSDNTFADYPLPGSVAPSGAEQTNPEMLRQLNAINVLAYAFLQTDAAGNVYFNQPAIDLSSQAVGVNLALGSSERYPVTIDLAKFCHTA